MGSPDKVQCLHLLVKHEKSRNPESRRTGQSSKGVTVAQAHEELKKYEAKLKPLSGKELQTAFEKAAFERSDCSSHKKNGDLGLFGRGQMQKPFEEASFALDVGKMSGIVDSDSGSHLILRIA